MKRNFECLMMMAVLLIMVTGGCKKKANTPAPMAPDVSNFSATAPAAYTEGHAGTVVVNSTSLAAGSYTLKYHYTKDTSSVAVQGDLIISNHSGSFETPVLTEQDRTYITIDSIINSQGNGAAITTGNLVTLADSTGMMTVLIGDKSYKPLYLFAQVLGNNLFVSGSYFYPGSKFYKTIWFEIDNFIGIAPYTFSGGNGPGSNGHIDNVDAGYTSQDSRYGTFTITATAPQLKGTFSFTAYDSTKVSGSFVAPQP